MLNAKKKELYQKVPYPRKDLKLVKNPLETLEWVICDHTLSKKKKKKRETRSTKALTKRYGLIFTCLTTHAIQIKLPGDLSMDSFLLALRRFISRRGYVKVMQSDNNTNFVGANNKLNDYIKQLDQIKLHKFSNHQNIE